VPDWLRGLQDENPSAPAPDEAPAEPADVPDWMSQFQEPPAAKPADAPDWTSQFQEPDAPAPTAPADESDWLHDFQESPTLAMPAAPAQAEPPAAPADMPDWMSQFQEPPASVTGAAAPDDAQAAPADMPDWMSQFQEPPASLPGAPAFDDTPAAPANVPDWMNQFQPGPATAETPASAASTPSKSGGETPDWLKEYYTPPTTGPAGAQPGSDTDWMTDMAAQPPVSESSSRTEALPGADLPDWLRPTPQTGSSDSTASRRGRTTESRPQPYSRPEPPAGDALSPFASTEMNEMLAGLSAESERAAEPAGPGEAENLEPAQLPNWLQAMRPVESGVSNIPTGAGDDARVEKNGPLAGLRGVLPGEDLVSRYRKPPIYTNKLQVSEKQHLHASLLESLVNAETQSQPLPGEAVHASQLITRLLIAVLLVVLIVAPAIAQFKLAVPGGLRAVQPGAQAMLQSIGTLPQGMTVLVVADFEAGLTGELKAASQAVLRDLQKRQARVVLTSTLPAGSVLGETLLKNAKITPLANLGYLAGGAQTLKRLAAHTSPEQPAPLAEIVPFLYPGGYKWNEFPALQGVHDITSFQRILVLTDSVETARAWVEQVQPALGAESQMLMISSAQAAPLVRTYLESGQVRGLIGGLAGGAAYEQLSGQPGLAAASWTAYQLTIIAVILLIVAGAIAAGLSNLLQRSKKRKA
jgi:hypothetical protein